MREVDLIIHDVDWPITKDVLDRQPHILKAMGLKDNVAPK
jgi:hypothetical protein